MPILVVEDNDEDFDMLQLAFRGASIPNPLFRCADGEETLEFLGHQGRYQEEEQAPRPGLVLLDLNLPGMDGRQVLERLKADASLRSIPVIVFSTSDNPRDVQSCYQLGVSAYLLKPVDLDRFERMVRLLKEFWLDFVVLPALPVAPLRERRWQ
ncbi:response regulator [Stigmatella aurantiaca]|uniref:Two-component system response regulator n=1 Tax=Stigmatella aurantiaca (strain DW4/3-1) TaxID=378806 RepID=Q097N2_STIAD|nr:response regulator [Stigmatella aurantiaca]EAU67952.1 two-component system response regulator [Stigmatella aurantiaca DW4/3-1]